MRRVSKLQRKAATFLAAILTWISPEIQWGDKLRIRYLQDYIKILKENGFVEWAETIENLEDKDIFMKI
jgi:hypothetical protein